MKYIKTFESFSYLPEEQINEGFLGNLMYKIKSFFKGKSMLGKELKAEFDKYNFPTRFEEVLEAEKDPKIDMLYKKVASGSQLTKEDAKLISSPIDLLLLMGYRLNSDGKFSLGTMQAEGGVESDTVIFNNPGNELLQLFGFDSSKYRSRQELAIAKTEFISGILVPNIFEDYGTKLPAKTYFVENIELDFSKEIPSLQHKNVEYYSILLGDFVYYKEDYSTNMDLYSKIESGVSLGGVFSQRDKEQGPEIPKFSTITLHQFVEKFQTGGSYNLTFENYSKALDERKPELVPNQVDPVRVPPVM